MDPITLPLWAIIVGLVMSAAGVGTGIWSMFHNSSEQEKMQQAQFDEAAYQAQLNREWSEKMQNKANAWNMPIHQVQMMKDAGLNPALMYGGSSPVPESAPVPSGAMASPAGMSAMPFDSSALMSAFSNVGQSINDIADFYKKKSELKLNDQQALVLKQSFENMRKEANNIVLKGKEIMQNIATSESQQRLNDQLGKESAQRVTNLMTENQQMIESFPQKLQQLDALTQSYYASAEKDRSQAKYIDEQAKYYGKQVLSQLELNKAMCKELISRSDLNEAHKNEVEKTLGLIDEQIKSLQIQNDIQQETGKLGAYVSIISEGVSTLAKVASSVAAFMAL